MDRFPTPCTFLQPVDLHDELAHLAFQPGLLDLLALALGFGALPVIEDPGCPFEHLALPLRYLHRVQIIFRRDFVYCFEPLEGLQRYPRLEL